MFGGSPFGGGANTGFGSAPAPFGGGGGFGSNNNNNNNSGFGSSGFGSTPAAPFGSPAPAPSTGFGGFGAPAPAPGGFGGFGTNQSNTNTAFGGGSNNTFGGGASAFGGSSTPFGSPAPAPTGLFGAPAPAPFGASAPAPGGLFGAPAPAPAGGMFGAPANTGFGGSGFGSSTNPGFGTPAPAAGFGSSAPAPAFGAPAPTGGMFGAAPAPAGGGLFGGGAPAGGGQGTSGTQYSPTTRQDGNSSVSMVSITAMQAYEQKSLEELRYEDYLQGNKGKANAAGGAGGGFGGAFGSPAPAPTGGLFGAPAPAPPGGFGSFGAPAPATAFGATTNTFGKPASSSLFGAAPAPAPTFAGFGSTTPAPAFGAAPTPGLFGSSPAPAPAFGAAPAPAFGGFGATPAPAFGAAPAPTGLFGSPSPAPVFGSAAPAPAFGFGAPAPAPAFGAPAPAPGLFGSAPAPPATFGAAPAPGGSIFGGGGFGAAPTPSLFGAKSPTPSIFGAPPAAPAFGSPAAAPAGGLFGQPPAAAAPPAYPPAGSIIPQAASEVLTHQIQALENKRKEMEKLDVWRGNSAEGSSVTPASQPQFDRGAPSGVTNNSQYSSYRPSPRSTAKIRPRGFGPAISPPASSASPLNTIGTGGRPMMSPDAYAASSVKRLVINPGTPKPKMRLRLTNGSTSGDANNAQPIAALPAASPAAATTPVAALMNGSTDQGSSPSPMKSPTPTGTPYTIPVFGKDTPPSAYGSPASARANPNVASGGKTVASLEKIAPPVDPGMALYQKVVGSPEGVPPPTPSPRAFVEPQSSRKKSASYAPRLTKPDYVVTPSLEELSAMSEADLATVSGFSVRHDPYGIVAWDGAVDVRNANLDASVVIGQSDVSVYTVDEEAGQKPAVGSKLNRPAVITFFNVFPKEKDGGANADEETKRKFALKIEKSTARMEAQLLSYDKDKGEWKIRVQHFSRYGLDDDASDVEEPPTQGTPEKQMEEAELWEDEELGMDDAAVVSDTEMEKDGGDVLREAEAAYASIFDTVNSPRASPPKDIEMEEVDEEEEEEFEDGEVNVTTDESFVGRVPITKEEYKLAASGHANSGICSRIASKVFAGERRAPTSIDYGARLGRSFRVAWSPDGSFVKIGGARSFTKIQKCRPVFSDPAADDGGYLDIHRANSRKLATSVDDGSSRFVLPVAIGNIDGDSSSHERIRQTISTYASKGSEVGNQAFSLLTCFVDSEESVDILEPMASRLSPETKDSQFQERRKEAVVRFLVQACCSSVKADVQAAIARSDPHGAVLAALTGGDLSLACQLAFENGLDELATCIAAFDADGSSDILASSNTKGSPELLPIYRLLGGDVRATADLDWMRALLVRLLYVQPQRENHDLPQVLQAFNEELGKTAPFPVPAYARGMQSTAQSILYRLLLLAELPQTTSLVDIINPSGASQYKHDFTLAFHLASCVSALCVAGSMSSDEEAHLIDGYCAQLCASGRWEWAVYICLCSLNPNPGTASSSSTDWKRSKAKDLVLRNFHLKDPQSAPKRRFLERDVGVPKEWLFEALALRQVRRGDPFEYIGNLAAFSPARAAAVVDEVILPNLLFMSNSDLRKSLTLLESFQGELSPLSMAMLNLFELSKDLKAVMSAPHDEALEHLPAFAEDLQEIETTLTAHRSEWEKMKDGIGTKFCAPFEIIPISAMLYEASERCVFLRLQLKAIEMDIAVNAAVLDKNLTTVLAFHSLDGYSKDVVTAEVMRALR